LDALLDDVRSFVEYRRKFAGKLIDILELCAVPDPLFVRACYVALLDREPDAGGLAASAARLKRGETKAALALGVYSSEEGRAVGKILYIGSRGRVVPRSGTSELRDVIEQAAASDDQETFVANLPSLYAAPARNFVAAAHLLLRQREIEPEAATAAANRIDNNDIGRDDYLCELLADEPTSALSVDLTALPPELGLRVRDLLLTQLMKLLSSVIEQQNKSDAQVNTLTALSYEHQSEIRLFRYAFAMQDRVMELLQREPSDR
jgi:hypothetical protein